MLFPTQFVQQNVFIKMSIKCSRECILNWYFVVLNTGAGTDALLRMKQTLSYWHFAMQFLIVSLALQNCNAMFDCFISSSKLQYNIWLFHYLTVTMALELWDALFDCLISSSILLCNILFQIFIFLSQEDLGKSNTLKTMCCERVKIWICGWIIGAS